MLARATALMVCAVVAIFLFAAVSSKRDIQIAIASPAKEETFKCRQYALKTYIGVKRAATWKWQDATLIPHTRSSYQEKRVRGCAYLRWIKRLWQGRADDAFRLWVDLRDPQKAICHVFGVYCTEALAVSGCETGYTFDTKAENGQYLGLFQMGSSERATYGHGRSAIEQAVAAFRYFVASGRDWSPWSCQP